MSFSIVERAKCAMWFESTKSVVAVQRKFFAEFQRKPPSYKTILKWHSHLMENGSVLDSKRSRTHTVRTEESVAAVQQHFTNNPHSSTRRAAIDLTISRTSIQRVLKDLKWYPYKVQVMQKLHEEDLMKRLEFARNELTRIEERPSHLTLLTFSDEAHFHLDGVVNRHNHRYWAPQNPFWVTEQSLHSPRTTAWAAIGKNNMYGPFFFDESVNSDRYLAMLRDQFWPALQQNDKEHLLFMHDGAPPHWGSEVRRWLNDHFPQRWMGRGSPNMPWPPRSPDLTPCDFFMWGFIKSRVYVTRPTDILDLKQRIRAAFQEITAEMRENVIREYQKRLVKVMKNGGGHVEVCSE